MFTSGIEHGILQDSSEPSNDNPNVVNALREPFVVNQDPGKASKLEQVANLSTYPSKRFSSFCYDDDEEEDYTAVSTPDFLITDSLIMENEHLDTIPEMESDEFIKYSVENLVRIPSESEDFFDIKSECDMPDCDDSQTINFSTSSNPLFDDSTSSDDESSHEEFDPLLKEFSGEHAHTDLIPPRINEAFYDDHVKDNSSGSTTTHSDSSLYDSFIFDFRSIHFLLSIGVIFMSSPMNSLTSYLQQIAPQYLLSLGNKDTIFDPGICNYHISSFLPDVSHLSGTFPRFKVLNESPMEILFSTCSPWTNKFGVESGSRLG
nr:hypothetical protein [Tanacetum cinerariifolium]